MLLAQWQQKLPLKKLPALIRVKDQDHQLKKGGVPTEDLSRRQGQKDRATARLEMQVGRIAGKSL